MNKETTKAFNVIGLSVRTTNENGQSGQDIPALWNKFMSEGISDIIPNKIDDTLYCIYTEYEKDHTKPYTTLLGCAVTTLDEIPEGLTGKNIPANNCEKFVAKGSIMQGIVFKEWLKIWGTNLDRNYIADYEVYGTKAQDPENAEVEIFVGVR